MRSSILSNKNEELRDNEEIKSKNHDKAFKLGYDVIECQLKIKPEGGRANLKI